MNFTPVKINAADIKVLAAGSGFLPFAHHPHCDRHRHHLIWIGKRPLCLGCTGLYAGAPVGAVCASLIDWSGLSLLGWMVVHWLLLTPTVAQPFFQIKAFKLFSRFLLGAACGSYFVSGVFKVSFFENGWLWRGCVIVAFLAFYAALYTWRQKHINDPCLDCPLGRFPTCDWNMPRVLAANPDDLLLASMAANIPHDPAIELDHPRPTKSAGTTGAGEE